MTHFDAKVVGRYGRLGSKHQSSRRAPRGNWDAEFPASLACPPKVISYAHLCVGIDELETNPLYGAALFIRVVEAQLIDRP